MSIEHPHLNNAIAVIGMSGRFPDAENVETFWRNLENGLESLIDLSDSEILGTGMPPALLQNPNFVKRATPFDRGDWFDAGFFGFNPREAEILDPQHRVFLESAWEALEDAGYGGDERPESVGVYAGASGNTYVLNNVLANPRIAESVGGYQIILANDKDFLATRVSYKLDLKGPSVTVQTACSTSLVAVQMACQSLLAGQCDLALAGGVSLVFPHKTGYLYTEGMIFSPDGHCRPFDENGRGIRAGYGAGVVLLKRFNEALKDRDAIRALLLGAAINNDGAAKMGYSTPSVEGQSKVISAAIHQSQIDPSSISFVEAHGTGTQVGDPIEIAGLERAFRARTDKKQFCAIGAVKANIGHLDAAAGVAGLIKTILALQHKRIPPTILFQKANPAIDFANSPFYVNDKLSEWHTNGSPRRAGVSSFGIGGTNAHVVLEEAPESLPSQVLWPSQLLVLSARTDVALEAMTTRMALHLEDHPSASIADIAYTAQVGRKRFPHRRMLVCNNRGEAIEALRGTGTRKPVTAFEESNRRTVAFMFSGQGSQHLGMAQNLYEVQPLFRHYVDLCADLLIDELGLDLRKVLFSKDTDSTILNETRITQPALFTIEYALARMWMSWGVAPEAMIGHSIGEYVAACLAGVFPLEDVLKIVAARGRIMQQMPPGSMLAVSMPMAAVSRLLNEQLSLAAVNAPSLCTLSGPKDAIAAIKAKIESEGIICRQLHTSHAFHSWMMDGALGQFRDLVGQMQLSLPNAPFISNVTGTWITAEQATNPEYWVRHLRQTVQFAPGISELMTPGRIFLEIGPGQVLSTFARDWARGNANLQVLASLPHPKDVQSDVSFLLNTVGKLWVTGVPINWEEFHRGEKLQRVPLPTYFFERKRYCVEPQMPAAAAASKPDIATDGLTRREDITDWFYVPSWQRSVVPTVIASDDNYGPWLIFADDKGLADQICGILSARSQQFTLVRPGPSFARCQEGEYTIRPEEAEDYARLLNDIRSRSSAPRSVLHLWSLFGSINKKTGKERTAFHSLILLAQAYGDRQFGNLVDWVIITSGLHTVTGSEVLDPEQAFILGPGKVIPREYSNIHCRLVDIVLPLDSESDQYRIAENLLLEPGMPRPWRQIAYREGQRWEQTFEAVRLPARPPCSLRHQGVYLITGGMGGIGFTIAAHLAEQRQARLALIGRTKMPERSQWRLWLQEHGENNSNSRKIRDIEKLEALGAEVLVLSADVSDRLAMESAVRTIDQRFGPINGIIHAAGIGGGGLIQLKKSGASEEILSAKVAGTLVLDSLLKTKALDFFVLCSSVDAISPIVGAVDYCAANAFLDAYAHAQQRMGAPVISINWDTWQEVGMAEAVEVPRNHAEQRRAYMKSAIRPTEGVEAFERVLATRMAQVAVITRDLPRLITEIANSPTPAALMTGMEVTPAEGSDEPGHSRPALSNAFVPPETDIQKKLADIWIEVLGIAEIGIDDNFFEMGGHSLLATGVLSRIRNSFAISVPLRTIFETPTIRQFSDHIETLLWVVSGKSENGTETAEREEIEL